MTAYRLILIAFTNNVPIKLLQKPVPLENIINEFNYKQVPLKMLVLMFIKWISCIIFSNAVGILTCVKALFLPLAIG